MSGGGGGTAVDGGFGATGFVEGEGDLLAPSIGGGGWETVAPVGDAGVVF